MWQKLRKLLWKLLISKVLKKCCARAEEVLLLQLSDQTYFILLPGDENLKMLSHVEGELHLKCSSSVNQAKLLHTVPFSGLQKLPLRYKPISMANLGGAEGATSLWSGLSTQYYWKTSNTSDVFFRTDTSTLKKTFLKQIEFWKFIHNENKNPFIAWHFNMASPLRFSF